MKTQGEPPTTVRTWAKVLVFGGVTAAALFVLLGRILPLFVLDPPYGFGIHPFLAHNPGTTPGKDDTYGRVVAGLLAWLGGTHVGIRTAGIHRRREQGLAALVIAGVVAILFVANGLLLDAARTRCCDEEVPVSGRVTVAVATLMPLATRVRLGRRSRAKPEVLSNDNPLASLYGPLRWYLGDF
jgi:hypothetical protein